MTDQQHKRRVLIAIVAAVAMIGAIGVTISLLVDEDGASTAVDRTTPGASVDPLTVEGQCRAAGVARYDVATGSAAAQLTATAAAEPWVLDGETSQTTSAGDTEKLVAIGRPGRPPRVVLVIDKSDTGWAVVRTGGCLDPATSGRACTKETFTLGRTVYTRTSDDTEKPAAGTYVGTGYLRLCPELVEGQQLAARGTVAPVSAYATAEKTGVVVSDATGSKLFTR